MWVGLIQVVACGNTRGPVRRLSSSKVGVTVTEMFLSLLSSTATPENMLELSEIVV